MLPARSTLAFVLAFALPAGAANIDVFPTSADALQLAIDGAAPGDRLIIHGGTYDPIVISKPLELIAEPQATIVGKFEPDSPFASVDTPIVAFGPGSGELVLNNLRTGGGYDVTIFTPSGPPSANITLSGFERVVAIDCVFTGPQWFANGGISGAPGLVSDAPVLVLDGTSVRALNPASDSTPISPPTAAVIASDSTVIATDCDIVGGYYISPLWSSFGGQAPILGIGGTGVVCDRLFQTGGSIQGGLATQWGEPPLVNDGVLPAGPPAYATQHVLLWENLRELTTPRVGQLWELEAQSGTAGGSLRIALDLGPAEFEPTFGWNFVETLDTIIFQTTDPFLETLSFSIPPVPGLVGLDLVAELSDLGALKTGGVVVSQIR